MGPKDVFPIRLFEMELVPLKHDLAKSIGKFLNILSIACGLLALILLVVLLLFTIEYNKDEDAISSTPATTTMTTKKPTLPAMTTPAWTTKATTTTTTEQATLTTDKESTTATTKPSTPATSTTPELPDITYCDTYQCHLNCCVIVLESCSVTCTGCVGSVDEIIRTLSNHVVQTKLSVDYLQLC